jgi:hypothetical protein
VDVVALQDRRSRIAVYWAVNGQAGYGRSIEEWLVDKSTNCHPQRR